MAGFADKRNITLLSSVFSQSEKIGREYLDGVDIDRLLSPIFEAHNMPAPNNAKRYGGWERKSANANACLKPGGNTLTLRLGFNNTERVEPPKILASTTHTSIVY